MDANVVLVLTWIGVALLVAAYIAFVAWRYRAERRKKAAAMVAERSERSALLAAGAPPAVAPPAATPSHPDPRSPVPSAPHPGATSSSAAHLPTQAPTVVALLAGIRLPFDLVPITMMAPRDLVGDRVAFWTDRGPPEAVGTAFADELKRIGYTIAAIDELEAGADRGDDHLITVLHLDARYAVLGDERAFPAVADGAVVVEVWVPL